MLQSNNDNADVGGRTCAVYWVKSPKDLAHCLKADEMSIVHPPLRLASGETHDSDVAQRAQPHKLVIEAVEDHVGGRVSCRWTPDGPRCFFPNPESRLQGFSDSGEVARCLRLQMRMPAKEERGVKYVFNLQESWHPLPRLSNMRSTGDWRGADCRYPAPTTASAGEAIHGHRHAASPCAPATPPPITTSDAVNDGSESARLPPFEHACGDAAPMSHPEVSKPGRQHSARGGSAQPPRFSRMPSALPAAAALPSVRDRPSGRLTAEQVRRWRTVTRSRTVTRAAAAFREAAAASGAHPQTQLFSNDGPDLPTTSGLAQRTEGDNADESLTQRLKALPPASPPGSPPGPSSTVVGASADAPAPKALDDVENSIDAEGHVRRGRWTQSVPKLSRHVLRRQQSAQSMPELFDSPPTAANVKEQQTDQESAHSHPLNTEDVSPRLFLALRSQSTASGYRPEPSTTLFAQPQSARGTSNTRVMMELGGASGLALGSARAALSSRRAVRRQQSAQSKPKLFDSPPTAALGVCSHHLSHVSPSAEAQQWTECRGIDDRKYTNVPMTSQGSFQSARLSNIEETSQRLSAANPLPSASSNQENPVLQASTSPQIVHTKGASTVWSNVRHEQPIGLPLDDDVDSAMPSMKWLDLKSIVEELDCCHSEYKRAFQRVKLSPVMTEPRNCTAMLRSLFVLFLLRSSRFIGISCAIAQQLTLYSAEWACVPRKRMR